VPVPLLIFAACAVLVAVLLGRTPWGQRVYMVGSNEQATQFSGVDTRRVLLGVYVLSSCLCCMAALLMMARFNSARAGYAESYLLVTILAAVLGGIDPFGGFGRIMGLVAALCVLQVIATGFNLLGFNPQLTLAIWGATLIAVLAIGSLRRRTG
jgi:simple sugar transport system permease protein